MTSGQEGFQVTAQKADGRHYALATFYAYWEALRYRDVLRKCGIAAFIRSAQGSKATYWWGD